MAQHENACINIQPFFLCICFNKQLVISLQCWHGKATDVGTAAGLHPDNLRPVRTALNAAADIMEYDLLVYRDTCNGLHIYICVLTLIIITSFPMCVVYVCLVTSARAEGLIKF